MVGHLVDKESNALATILETELQTEAERVKGKASKLLKPGNAFIGISFNGILNDKLRGFYRSIFHDEAGAQKTIATTHFEATDARRAFPSFDEPDFKARFNITLDIENNHLAVSNWPILNETRISDFVKRVTFEETVPMSTYLVAFIVGPLEATTPINVKGAELRVVHIPGKAHMAPFALEIGQFSLEYFSNYFSIEYPGKKLDLIALPDFAFGAMENLGAVTFRETALLADPETASRSDYERVADVVAHELAHMWFGDLVTMKWWNGIWLNEAFATFMEMKCVDEFRKDWDRWVTFGLSREAAMAIDGISNTRPIEFPVKHPSEAEGMFDVLTYQKGASVLRMLEQFMGEEQFRNGISNYLIAHSYSNTETSDLWDALESAHQKSENPEGLDEKFPVKELMDSWIFQGGYPLVEGSLQGDSLTIKISPFKYSEKTGAIGKNWLAPVTIGVTDWTNDSARIKKFVMKEHDVHLDIKTLSQDSSLNKSFLSLNFRGSGFYRVKYDDLLLDHFLTNIDVMEKLEKFNLISDTFAAVQSQITPLESYLKLVNKFGIAEEKDPNIWSIIGGSFRIFERTLGISSSDKDTNEVLSNFIRSTLNPLFLSLGFEHKRDEPETFKTLRAIVLSMLGTLGNDNIVKDSCLNYFEMASSSSGEMDPDLSTAILDVVAFYGEDTEYEAVLNRYRNPKSPQDEQRHLFALGSFRKESLIKNTLELSMSEVRTQNAPYLLQSMLTNVAAQTLTWTFIENNFEKMCEVFPSPTISRMLDGIRALSTLDSNGNSLNGTRAIEFVRNHPIHSGQKTVDQSVERLENLISFTRSIRERLASKLSLYI